MRTGPAFAALLLALAGPAYAATHDGDRVARQVWFSGVDPVVQGRSARRHAEGLHGPVQARCSVAGGRVPERPRSRSRPSWSFGARTSSCRTVFEGLRQRHVALAIELGVLVNSDACGKGSRASGRRRRSRRWRSGSRSLGGELERHRHGRARDLGARQEARQEQAGLTPTARDSIDQLADQAAARAQILKRYFPNVRDRRDRCRQFQAAGTGRRGSRVP